MSHEPLQAVSNVIELKPDKKYLLVFKGSLFAGEEILKALQVQGIQGIGIALGKGQELEVIEVPEQGATA